MSTCMDCGWPASIEYVKGVVLKDKDGTERRYKIGEDDPEGFAKEMKCVLVGLCAIRQRDCGCDG